MKNPLGSPGADKGEGRPVTEAVLEHARLRELVAALADGELSPGDRSYVEEHLRACPGCRRTLALHQSLSRALAEEPVPEASLRLRRRIEQLGTPAPTRTRRAFLASQAWAAPVMVGLVLIAVGAWAVLFRRGDSARPFAEIPVIRDALADCSRATARNFPRKADLGGLAQGLPFPVRALDRPDAELFSTWKTTLAGAPAAGLAYRWHGVVVVQYAVPAELIRKQPTVGEALRLIGHYLAVDGTQGIVASLGEGSGTVLLADAPPEELRRLIL